MVSLLKIYCYFFCYFKFSYCVRNIKLEWGNVKGLKTVYMSFIESSNFGGLLNLTREG